MPVPSSPCALRRYWFPLPGRLWIGVTAASADEAVRLATLARDELWSAEAGQPLPQPVEDVDIRALDQKHLVPNMGVAVVRGVWFPIGFSHIKP